MASPEPTADLDPLMDKIEIMRPGIPVISHPLGVGLSGKWQGSRGEEQEGEAH